MKKLTYISFCISLYLGVSESVIGVTIIEMAKMFQVDTYIIGYIYTFFHLGGTIAIFGNGYILRKVNHKKELIIAITIIISGIIGLVTASHLVVFGCCIFYLGSGIGLLGSLSNYILINLYEDHKRVRNITLLQFFFSIGAISAPAIAGLLAKYRVQWQWNYIMSILVLFVILGLLSVSSFEDVKKENKHHEPRHREPWNYRVLLISVALLCYTLSEFIYTQWVVVYLEEKTPLTVDLAAYTLSCFWISMTIGRFVSSIVLHKFTLTTYIMTASLFAASAYALLFICDSAWIVFPITFLIGLGYSALYAAIMLYGTSQQQRTTPHLMTFIITMGSIGVIFSSPLASILKKHFSITFSLAMGVGFMVMVSVFIALSTLSIFQKNIKPKRRCDGPCNQSMTCCGGEV